MLYAIIYLFMEDIMKRIVNKQTKEQLIDKYIAKIEQPKLYLEY